MSVDRQPVTASDAPAAAGPYSHAVRSGGFLFLSGQTPVDPAAGKLVDGDIGEHTRQCLRNLQTVCAEAGASLADAVRCGIYVTDIGTFGEVNAAYAEFFPENPPARSTIGVASLPLGAQVEIDAIVALGS
ncbi:2-iminobutanoate/2-iminopropanoate deaminase [Baekduia alba]|uniref:RidA family protein n=1 Tax=Baekduia alba TaxID=2997333 RepID=UPI00233FCC7B|nr:Rid family detoxifying hydrolase [Baekduia alba]WCB93144.1 2-iminobutanoate/2-iminopropanoate deaminase [Baekduia alba]